MDELTKDFLVETAEALGALNNDLVLLEAAPGDQALISRVFRTLHTVKGTSGFLGLSKLGRLAHAGENVLGMLRAGTMTATPNVISIILQCVDAIKTIVATLEGTDGEGEDEHTSLLAALEALCNPSSDHPPGAPASLATAAPGQVQIGELTSNLRPDLTPAPAPAPAASPPPTNVTASPAERAQPAHEPVIARQTIRVGIELLETLMISVSELVLTRNQLLQLLRNEKDSVFSAPLQHLSLVTSELQESVLKTRMQPIGNVWATLPRLIRDLARDLGKKINLVMDGAETELDRQVLELIKDPLIHVVRNAADHGLEQPADRLAAGKDETALIRLSAVHEGGHIIVQVSDDGRGLDVERIRRKALQTGMATEAELATMSDAQIFRFVLRPGFSTAAAVTAVSGRGVGMDVVRVNVEKIGGTLDLSSTPGRGACVTLKIPLTLAIVSALIVGCAGGRFAIPQISVVELVLSSESGESRIERIGETALLRLRERLLPLIRLRDLLRLDAVSDTAAGEVVIVLQVGALQFGLVVDQVYDTEEIVVKPVAPVLSGIDVYSGNTILGDGSVCLIIDPNGIVRHLGHTDIASDDRSALDRNHNERRADRIRQRLLLVRAGAGIRKAIPLDQIARLEEVDVRQISYSGGQMIVLYRNRLMPLIPASADLQLRTEGTQPVLVFIKPPAGNRNGAHLDRRRQHIGLIVDEILDITESDASIEIEYGRPDMIGSAIIDGEPTDVMNVAFHLGQAGASPADRGMNDPAPVPEGMWLPERAGSHAQHEVALHAPD